MKALVALVVAAMVLTGCGAAPASATHPTANISPKASARPLVPLTLASTWSVTDTDKVVITGSTIPGALMEVTWGDGRVATMSADGQGAFTLNGTALAEGDSKLTVTVKASGYDPTSKEVTVTRVVSPATYKASAASIPYNQLVKDPASLSGRVVTYTGQVFQYDSATTTSNLIISVTDGGYGFWSDHIWVDIDPAVGQNVYNKTVIRFWGTVVGAYTYKTTANGSLTIPEIKLRYLDVVSQG